MVKICEVVDGCEDCPKYGDDCDGAYQKGFEAGVAAQILKEKKELTDREITMYEYGYKMGVADTKADAIEVVAQQWLFEASVGNPYVNDDDIGEYRKLAEELFEDVPSADAVQGWIPVSERLPEDIRPVLVTWKNNDPASYYQYIVGKHYIGTAHYYRGKWYWYSSVTEDLLAEYGKCDTEEFDEAIEAVAWMPLPKPYECGARMKGGDE